MSSKEYDQLYQYLQVIMKEIGIFRQETNENFARVYTRLDNLEARVEKLEARMGAIETEVREVRGELQKVKERLRKLEVQVSRYHAVGFDNQADLRDLEERVEALEVVPA